MSYDPTPNLMVQREGEAPLPAEALDLGAHVRALRKARGWTLEQAAVQAGLARSTLSKIENGQMSPTFEALKKLAQGMGLTIPQLFTPAAKPRGSGRFQVTKSGQGQAQITPTYEHELLAQGLTGKRMLPYRARIRSHDVEDFDGWIRHAGEEFLYVLTGVVRLYTEFYEPVELKRGDSAYYDAAMGHNVISVSDDDATVLWVTSQV
jgi:transcriptional regulator with XRE-family HTH domain